MSRASDPEVERDMLREASRALEKRRLERLGPRWLNESQVESTRKEPWRPRPSPPRPTGPRWLSEKGDTP